ncbi:hypothetical protein EZY14_009365 [Kordia sp. TARA_039_SRF]|nr:hypothetical protein EZY14_009365 [Kordia sp. TARA_039_SRF]
MVKNRETLKEYFSTGKKPTQGQFADLIDSMQHVQDEQIVKFGQFKIFKHPNNNEATLQPSDRVQGWFDSETFFESAIYLGGDKTDISNWNVIIDSKPFEQAE